MKIKTAVCLLPLLALAGCGENNSAPLCNGTDNLASSMTEWLNEAMVKEDSGAKKLLLRLVLNFFCWQRQERFSHGENRRNWQ